MVNYKLTKRHVACYDRSRPILIADDGSMGAGPFDRNAALPFGNGARAEEIVLCALAKSPLKTDPAIAVDEGADFREYCLEYLGISSGEVERARWITRIFDSD